MKFQELTPKFQNTLLELGKAYFALKGVSNPDEEIKKFTQQDLKNSRKWRAKMYFRFMKGIDNHREKLGLSRLYSKMQVL